MDKVFGRRLKSLRIQNCMQQAELAKALQVSQNTIHMWESGRTEPSIAKLNAIADYFEVTVDVLLGRDLTSVNSRYRIDLSAQEIRLLLSYEKLVDNDRNVIVSLIDIMLKQKKA